MKSAQIIKIKEKLSIVDLPDPKPRDTQVLVRIEASGVCHSDIHLWEGGYEGAAGTFLKVEDRGVKFPITPGHEISGRIEAIGESVTGFNVGDKVVVYPWIGEGSCPACRVGQENLCDTPRTIGIYRDGGYSELVLVPNFRYLVKIDEMDVNASASLACSGLTAYNAVKKAKVAPGESIVIIGAGGLGLMSVQLARAITNSRIIVVDVDDKRLSEAKKLGAHEVVNSSKMDPSLTGSGVRPFPETLSEILHSPAPLGPFLVVLENLHAAGSDAVAALRVAAAAMPSTKGLLLLTYRSEERHSSGTGPLRSYLLWTRGEGLAEEITLGRFRPEETGEMIARLLPDARQPEERLVKHVHGETEGNPLFVRETVRYLLETHRMTEAGDLVSTQGSAPLPHRIRDILGRRLSELSPDLLRVLQTAAVEGEVFRSRTIAGLLGITRTQALAALERLVRDHELVVAIGEEYRFSHAKFREVVSDTLLPERRAELHGQLADLLGRETPAPIADVARHLVAAGRLSDALPSLLQAAEAARNRAAVDEARELYALAIEAFGHDSIPNPSRIRTLVELGKLQRMVGENDEAKETLEEAARSAQSNDPSRGLAFHNLGWLRLRAGDLHGAKDEFIRAIRTFDRVGDRVNVASGHDGLGVVHRHLGDLKSALREARSALVARERIRSGWGIAVSQSNLGAIYIGMGDFRRALESFLMSRRYFQRFGKSMDARLQEATALGNIGVAYEGLGRLELAMESYAEALRIKTEMGDRQIQVINLVNLSDARLALGLRTTAGEGYERAARLAAELRNHAVRAHALRGLARVRTSEGKTADATRLLDESLREARTAHDAEAEGRACLEIALAHLNEKQLEAAAESLTIAKALARKGGLEMLAARTAHVEARLELARARPAAARSAGERALEALRKRPEPEIAWRVLRDLADLAASSDARGAARAKRLRAQARSLVREVAKGITDPALRETYLSDPERAALLESSRGTTVGAPGPRVETAAAGASLGTPTMLRQRRLDSST